jgi:hypothetical protein
MNVPVDNTPLEAAHQLQPLFGNTAASVANGTVHISLPSQTLAVFSVQ